jgi:hypothetical protein
MLNTLPAILILAAGAFAGGQAFGSLSGTVTDPTGGVLPGARIALTQPDRQARYEIRTDPQGRFDLPGLVLGNYQLEIDLAGFERYVAGVTVATAPIQRSIALRIGRLQETIRIVESDVPPPPLRPALGYTEPACLATAGPAGGIGGNLRPPKKLRDAKPEYPASLRGSGRDVTISVDATVGLDGYLKDFEPREPYDREVFNSLAAALQQWRFSATLLNCVPQEVAMTVTAAFVHR